MSHDNFPVTIYREEDGEALGEVRATSDGYDAATIFGGILAKCRSYDDAVAVLERCGLASLSSPWFVETDPGQWDEVRILEVRPDRVRIKRADPLCEQPPQGQWIHPSATPLGLEPRGRQ